MKKLLLVVLCFPLLTLAQQTYVPDDNFEAYLEANGMGNGIANDDSVTTSNIDTITTLVVGYQGIYNLTGIEDFSALTYLRCGPNPLTGLDVSNNTALTHLNCCCNQLTTLDVSQNTALDSLDCGNNQLTTLDLSNNTALTYLYCYNNQLTSLDVSQNNALNYLYFSDNQLTSLDVSQNTALTYLSCSYNSLTNLDLSNNTALTYLYCNSNPLTILDVSQNTALTTLYCNSNQLTSLDVRNGNNQNFLNFNVTSNPNLTCINVDDVNYSTNSWTNIDAQHYFSTNCSPPLPPQTYIPDDNFEAYLEANGMGNDVPNDDSVTTSNINTITSLDVSSKAISDLTGIEDFTALTELNCLFNQLTSLDVSQNTALSILNCNNNQLTSLDVSNNTALTELNCFFNQLTSLDVSQNTALTYLSCYSNQLTSLDVSYNTALTELYCSYNQLNSLDVRNVNNQNLLNFYVTSNPNLTCINVDDVNYSTNNWTNIDAQHYFSTNCSAPNSVQEIINTISLYPNPTNENVTISIENFNGNIQTEVYDLIGNMLQTTNETTISLQDYARGIYLLKVAYADRVEEVKVIKE